MYGFTLNVYTDVCMHPCTNVCIYIRNNAGTSIQMYACKRGLMHVDVIGNFFSQVIFSFLLLLWMVMVKHP